MILAALLACGSPASAPAPAPVPVDPCESAWTEAAAVRDGIDALGTKAVAPSHDAFVAACQMLPEPARPCMSPSWQADHRDTCRVTLDAVPRDVQRAIDARLVSP